MNFRDGDIDRYYMPTIALAAPLIGVAVAFLGALVATAVAEISLRFEAGRATRRRGDRVCGRGRGARRRHPGDRPRRRLPAHDQSANRAADAWVASVYDELPPNSVIISWWSYSTPLWYHRWILGARPTSRSSTSATSSTMATVRCAGPSSPTSAGGPSTSSRRRGYPQAIVDQFRPAPCDLPGLLRDSQDRGTSPVTDAERPRLTFFFPAFNEEENVARRCGERSRRSARSSTARSRCSSSTTARRIARRSWPTSSPPPTRGCASTTSPTAATGRCGRVRERARRSRRLLRGSPVRPARDAAPADQA